MTFFAPGENQIDADATQQPWTRRENGRQRRKRVADLTLARKPVAGYVERMPLVREEIDT